MVSSKATVQIRSARDAVLALWLLGKTVGRNRVLCRWPLASVLDREARWRSMTQGDFQQLQWIQNNQLRLQQQEQGANRSSGSNGCCSSRRCGTSSGPKRRGVRRARRR